MSDAVCELSQEIATPRSNETPAASIWTRALEIARRPSSLSVFDQAVVSATNLATGVVLGRLCAADGYGSYVLAMTVAIIGSGLLCELVTNPFTVFGHRRSGRSLALYAGSACLHLVLATIAILIAILAVIAVSGQIGKLWGLLPIVVVAAPLAMTREFVRQMSFATFRFDRAVAVDVGVSILQCSGLLLLWLTDSLTAATALGSLGFACGVSVFVWFARVRSEFVICPRFARVHAIRNWRFARWTMLAYLIGSTTPFIMPWIVAGFHGEDATGRLAASNALIGLSYMFVSGVSNWLTPKAARAFREGGQSKLISTLVKTTGALMVVLVPFVGGIWLFGEQLVVFVFDSDFAGLGLTSFVVALGVLFNTGNVVAGNGLWAINRPQNGLWADGTTLLSTTGVAIAIVPSLGVLGGAIATTAGQFCGAAVRTALLAQQLKRVSRDGGSAFAVDSSGDGLGTEGAGR